MSISPILIGEDSPEAFVPIGITMQEAADNIRRAFTSTPKCCEWCSSDLTLSRKGRCTNCGATPQRRTARPRPPVIQPITIRK